MKQIQRKSTPWRTFGNWRKKLHKLGCFLLDSLAKYWFLQKYVQTLVWRTSSDFKIPRSSLKIFGFALYFQLFSVFRNRRNSSYSCLNYYLNSKMNLIFMIKYFLFFRVLIKKFRVPKENSGDNISIENTKYLLH